MKNHFGIKDVSIFGFEKITLLLEVSAQILDYLSETQKTKLDHIRKLTRYSTSDVMNLDQGTFRNLEIFEPLIRDERSATLLSVFERPKTPMGGRQLRSFVARPLLSVEKINTRN